MRLFVKWARGQDPACDDPAEIQWGNGRRATLADYIHHLVDTSIATVQDGSLTCTFFPDLIADVRFDEDLSRWVCQPPDQPRVILELSGRDIGDDQIIAELYTYPIVYRAAIHRHRVPSIESKNERNDLIRGEDKTLD
jgi:hypothetical protein